MDLLVDTVSNSNELLNRLRERHNEGFFDRLM